ncbi:MAG: response regulator [Planctomycetes bacterium]|nr:response regulator [Planctomycetota bacterium]
MPTILVVENDGNQRLLYQEELASDGHQVVLAKDGWEAVSLFEKDCPDLVVMDIHMPGMDGIEAMTRMLARCSKVPIVLHTAYSSYKDNFLTWSADAYVVKSADLSRLRATIREVLARRAGAQASAAASSAQ